MATTRFRPPFCTRQCFRTRLRRSTKASSRDETRTATSGGGGDGDGEGRGGGDGRGGDDGRGDGKGSSGSGGGGKFSLAKNAWPVLLSVRRGLRTGLQRCDGVVDGLGKTLVILVVSGAVLLAMSLEPFTGSHVTRDAEDKEWFHGARGVTGTRSFPAVPIVAAMLSGAFTVLVSSVLGVVQPLALPPSVHAIVATPMGFLLVFHFNNAYSRWWDGREEFGCIVGKSRRMAQSIMVLAGKQEPETSLEILKLLQLLPEATAHFLRKTEMDIDLVCRALKLSDEIKESMLSADVVPYYIMERIYLNLHRLKEKGAIPSDMAALLTYTCHMLSGHVGTCGKIHLTRTPGPAVVHVRTSLMLYLCTLPFVLLGEVGPAMLLPCQFVIAFTMLGIERVASELEDPFGLDPVDIKLFNLSRGIREDLVKVASRNVSEEYQHLVPSLEDL
uniref:Bestrophin homolog n=1 Tax=Picocystis salinarum TaxID=88271 RepID=A0A7S3UDU1_9CHLO